MYDPQSVRERLAACTESDLPAIVAIDIADDVVTLAIEISPELAWFDGHYPDMPILPGVAQVHMAARFAQNAFALDDRDFAGMDAVKFTRIVEPGFELGLELKLDKSRDKVRFRFFHGEQSCSSGRLLFRAAA